MNECFLKISSLLFGVSCTRQYSSNYISGIIFQLPDDCLVHETPNRNELILRKLSFIYIYTHTCIYIYIRERLGL